MTFILQKKYKQRTNSIVIFIAVFLIQITTLLANDKIIHAIDFTGQKNGSAISWLEKKGFKFELDANELNPRFENNALVVKYLQQSWRLDFMNRSKRVINCAT